MQKRIFVLVLVMILLNLSGCTVKEISKEQADNNFFLYRKEIVNLSKNAGFRIEEKKEDVIHGYEYSEKLILKQSKEEQIYVVLQYSTTGKEGIERFEIKYCIDESSNVKNSFNLNLFVELVNIISGKEISVEMCEEFLKDSKNKYSIKEEEANGFYIDHKQRFLNYFEDWSMSYSLAEDNSEELIVEGLTKASTK